MKIFLLFLLFSTSGYAYVPMLFDDKGILIQPDVILLTRGLKDYNKGATQSSMNHLKRSAQFGNEAAKYLIGLMHLEDSNAIKARAWLMLLKEPIYESKSVLKQLNLKLSPDELRFSNAELEKLKLMYNDDVSYKARKKWSKRAAKTGSNIAGLDGTGTRNLVTISGGEMAHIFTNAGISSPTQVTSFQTRKQVRSFVREYEPKGIVSLGEIKPKLD